MHNTIAWYDEEGNALCFGVGLEAMTRSTNPFWQSQAPTNAGRGITMEMLGEAMRQIVYTRVQGVLNETTPLLALLERE